MYKIENIETNFCSFYRQLLFFYFLIIQSKRIHQIQKGLVATSILGARVAYRNNISCLLYLPLKCQPKMLIYSVQKNAECYISFAQSMYDFLKIQNLLESLLFKCIFFVASFYFKRNIFERRKQWLNNQSFYIKYWTTCFGQWALFYDECFIPLTQL